MKLTDRLIRVNPLNGAWGPFDDRYTGEQANIHKKPSLTLRKEKRANTEHLHIRM